MPPLLWAVTSAFPSVLREWHSSFVLESPHLIHGRLTPESGDVCWPFRIPDSLIRWFLRHWITWPFVCSVPGWWGASALCELLTCKTRLEDAEWLMQWDDDCQQGHGERSVTPQRNKTATKGVKELNVCIEMSSNYSSAQCINHPENFILSVLAYVRNKILYVSDHFKCESPLKGCNKQLSLLLINLPIIFSKWQ